MKCLLNTEYDKIKELEQQFYEDADNYKNTLQDGDIFEGDVSAIVGIIEKAGQIQDGFFITDTIRIGNTRYVVGKKSENGQEQFCTCRTDKDGGYTDFRYHPRWFDAMQDFLTQTTATYDKMVMEHNKKHFKPVICKDCGCKLTGLSSSGMVYASSHYNGTEYCDSCMIEHCVNTNCLGCDRGQYPDCQFLDQKKFYMEDDD